MLQEFRASAMLVAADLERAKKFYEEKLGLKKMQDDMGVATFEAGENTAIVIYQKEGGPKATNSVVVFNVKNLETLLDELKANGVQQDMRDLPEGADENGIVNYNGIKAAWINDSEGNIIALTEMPA